MIRLFSFALPALRFIPSAAALLAAAGLMLTAPATHAQTAHAGGNVTYTSATYIWDVAFDASGNVFGDSYGGPVYRITFSGATYTATTLFTPPEAGQIAIDASGNIYVNQPGVGLAKYLFSGGVYTYSLLTTAGASGWGVAVDPAGNVFYTTLNPSYGLYELKYSGGVYSAPIKINTTTFSYEYGVSIDAAGNLYVSDVGGEAVYKYAPNGSAYTETKLALGTLSEVENTVADANGNLYIHTGNGILFAALKAGVYTVTTVAPQNNEGFVTMDPHGVVYAAGGNNNYSITAISAASTVVPNTAVGTAAAQTSVVFTIDTPGTLPALSNANVLTQGTGGLDFTLGTGSTCTGAVTAGSACVVNVVFTPKAPGQRLGAVNLTNSSGTVIATAYISGTGTGPLATLSPGLISTVAGNGTACATPTASPACGDGTAATAGLLQYPYGVAVDGAGNLYIADQSNQRIRKVTAATGFISTVAGNGTAGYTASQDTGTTAATAASLYFPTGVAVDGAGNLYIADQGNDRIRKVTAATGYISTVAGNGTAGYTASQDTGTTAATATSLNGPTGVAVDGAGNLYIADYANQRIRKVTAATGFISTVAGNGVQGYTPSQDTGTTAATAASLQYPANVTVDGAGNLYIADQSNSRIRKVTAATGFISTVAGNGVQGYTASQDTGTTAATAASLNYPAGVAVDGAGNLYIADQDNQRIRKVTAATGNISTLTGNGTGAYVASQDTGTTAATAASLYYPTNVAVDGAGNLYIADEYNQRIRKVSVTGDIVFSTATAAGTSDTTDGTKTLTVNNIGNLPLVFASQVETGSSFTLGNPMTGGCVSNGTIVAGGSCLIGATFVPVAGSTGVQGGYVTLTDNSLNVSGSVQTVLLEGTTTAGAATVTVLNAIAAQGATSATLTYQYGYSGSAADSGAVTVTVNGSSTGVGTPVCSGKASHKSCTVVYNPSSLALGRYNILVAVAADATDGYTAASGTGTLSITTSGMGRPEPGFALATPFHPAATIAAAPLIQSPFTGGTVLMEAVPAAATAADTDIPPATCSDEAIAAATKRGNASACTK